MLGQRWRTLISPCLPKFGEHRESLPNTTTRRGPNDEVFGVLGVGQDITQICEITREQERVADVLSRLIDSAMRQSWRKFEWHDH